MGKLVFKNTEVCHSVRSKAPVPNGHWKTGKERNAPIVIDDMEVSHVTIPNEKGGGKDMAPKTCNSIRKQLLLTRDEFTDFVKCPMSRTGYIEVIKARHPDWF